VPQLILRTWRFDADNGYPAWRIIMAGGDRLREFPRSAARAAQDRACQNAGCMGVTETKVHLLGSCRKERIAEIRRQFAADQRIGTLGGAFTRWCESWRMIARTGGLP
jgi:hypothetical protein